MSRLTYTITGQDTIHSVKELLRRRLGCSSRLLRKLKVNGGVALNDRPVKLFEKGRAGDVISVFLPEETSYFEPEDIPIDVLYEDDALLVINKQPGLVCHPTKGHACHTIANGVTKHMMEQGETYKLRFINRLDMDTSGLLLIGKDAYCQEDFARQSGAGTVVKRYLALTEGAIEEEEGVIDLPIALAAEDQVRRAVREDGYPSVTRYRVMQRFGRAYTLVELTLETGRTHQIRVHLSYIGHPVLGDVLYGRPAIGQISRQALHASFLSFNHPVTGEPLAFTAPLPMDMEQLLRGLEG